MLLVTKTNIYNVIDIEIILMLSTNDKLIESVQ